MSIKEALYSHCEEQLKKRIELIQSEIKLVQASANEETKSSAGDKYETGRAMAQLEVERQQAQLVAAESLLLSLQNIQTVKVIGRVIPGSLVTTSQGVYYISISLGIVEILSDRYFVVSPESPVGKVMLGKTIGQEVHLNNLRLMILGIV
jgi:transcription elongation GreA/GreB family factor